VAISRSNVLVRREVIAFESRGSSAGAAARTGGVIEVRERTGETHFVQGSPLDFN